MFLPENLTPPSCPLLFSCPLLPPAPLAFPRARVKTQEQIVLSLAGPMRSGHFARFSRERRMRTLSRDVAAASARVSERDFQRRVPAPRSRAGDRSRSDDP